LYKITTSVSNGITNLQQLLKQKESTVPRLKIYLGQKDRNGSKNFTTFAAALSRPNADKIKNCAAGWRHAVGQMVEALRYGPEGRGFDTRRGHCDFSLT
jgi:hypothetical protein